MASSSALLPTPKTASAGTLAELLETASARRASGLAYSGEVTCEEAYTYLQNHDAALVDVRTMPEWQFIGLPDLSAAKGKLVCISWKTYPAFAINGAFGDKLAAEQGITQETPLFFICRSGGRSLDAAIQMTQEGWRYCFNVIAGFEGEPDAAGHRGLSEGWKAAGLPWKQG